MGICASGNIFQDKVDKFLSGIKGIKTCINGILLLSKDILFNRIEKPMIIFGRLRAAGLKVNAHKCSFGLK